MGKSATWTNDDGLVVGFGARTSEYKAGGKPETDGMIEEHIVEFDYSDLPDGVVANMLNYLQVPANAIPVDAYLEVITAFTGGTSYDIDFVDSTGAAIGTGTNKLWDTLVLADISAVGDRSVSSTHGGVASGNALNVALASAGTIKVTAAGTFTAGKARIVVRYIQ